MTYLTTNFIVLVIALAASTTTCAAPALSKRVDATGASQSPGTLSGNVVQVPIVAPINVCGNSIDVIGVLNPAFSNECTNTIDHV